MEQMIKHVGFAPNSCDTCRESSGFHLGLYMPEEMKWSGNRWLYFWVVNKVAFSTKPHLIKGRCTGCYWLGIFKHEKLAVLMWKLSMMSKI